MRSATDRPHQSRRRIVLQELPPHMLAGVEAVDDRVDDARGAVDDVQRRMEAFLLDLERGDVGRIFVGDPAGVDAVESCLSLIHI